MNSEKAFYMYNKCIGEFFGYDLTLKFKSIYMYTELKNNNKSIDLISEGRLNASKQRIGKQIIEEKYSKHSMKKKRVNNKDNNNANRIASGNEKTFFFFSCT